jgi:hypothetical protein
MCGSSCHSYVCYQDTVVLCSVCVWNVQSLRSERVKNQFRICVVTRFQVFCLYRVITLDCCWLHHGVIRRRILQRHRQWRGNEHILAPFVMRSTQNVPFVISIFEPAALYTFFLWLPCSKRMEVSSVPSASFCKKLYRFCTNICGHNLIATVDSDPYFELSPNRNLPNYYVAIKHCRRTQ